MHTLTFTCETITPLFLAGADGKTPELRAPSIKGALRFWWRALHGDLSLEELRKREGEIFGSTSQRSGFSLRVRMVELNHEYVKLFNKTDEYRKNYPGIHYLLYSTFLPKNEKIAYPPGSLFELAFSFSHLQDYTEIIKAFTALLFFGAFGTRSRRGAGTFRVKKLKINSPDLNHKQAFAIYKNALSITTPQQLNEQYTEIQNFLASTASNDYSTLKDGTLYIFDPKNSWKESLDLIGREFKNFRGIKQSEIEKTPNFGFPIVHRNSKTTMQAGNNKAEKITRRSSPLLFRVAKTTDDKFFPMIIWLRGDLLPLGYEIMDTKAEHKAQPNPQIIQDFISTLSPACTVKL